MRLSHQDVVDYYMQDKRLMSGSFSSCLLLVVLSGILLNSGCSGGQQPEHSPAGSAASAAIAPPFSSEMWLKWDKSSRIAFVMGYLRGHWDGVGAGCGDATLRLGALRGVSGFTPEATEQLRMQCGTRYKPSNRQFESYESVITDFYTRFPEDRSVDVPDLLQLLGPDSQLTSQDLYRSIRIMKQ